MLRFPVRWTHPAAVPGVLATAALCVIAIRPGHTQQEPAAVEAPVDEPAPVDAAAAQTVALSGVLPAGATGRALTPAEVKPLLAAHPELSTELLSAMLEPGAERPAEWSCLGCHEAQLETAAWKASLHKQAGATCLHCHPEAAAVPHPESVSTVRCGDCHDGMDRIEAGAETSAHGPHGPGAANGCAGCHDPHTMTEAADAQQMAAAGCLECHDRDDGLADKHSPFLCAAELHLAKVGCLHCHLAGDDADAVHNVRFGDAAKVACIDCHGQDSVLALAAEIDPELEDDPGLLKAQNRRLIRETGYLIGANRIVGLDWAIVLLVLGACCFPVAHGGLRFLFRRAR